MRQQEPEIDWLKVLLGAFAIGGAFWLYTKYASASTFTEPEKEPARPKPPLSPSGSYEPSDQPGHEVFPGEFKMPSTSRSSTIPSPGPGEIGLVQGKTYRARLQLSGFERLGSSSQIAASFSELGFSNVRVYMKEAELPNGGAGFPGAPSSDPGARWVEGTWSRETQNVDKPPQVLEAREVA